MRQPVKCNRQPNVVPFDLVQLLKIMSVLEGEIKSRDVTVAHNIAREISAIYLKHAYNIPIVNCVSRLNSLLDYIWKVLPDELELVLRITEIRDYFDQE